MTELIVFSDELESVDWSEAELLKQTFGPKGATLAALPRRWTPPFALVSCHAFDSDKSSGQAMLSLGSEAIAKVRKIADITGRIYVRSSVIGETIWDRGSYDSVVVDATSGDFASRLFSAVTRVVASGPEKHVGLVLQSYVDPRARGEFGNLLRVSKTRDQWELSSDTAGATIRTRFNTQRDEAASFKDAIQIRGGISQARVFGPIAAWVNNYLLRGRSQRVNCEWIADHEYLYLVQVDAEDEDSWGVNPFQIRVEPIHQPIAARGVYLACPEGQAIREWDKLSVLNELWEPTATHKPTLFYVPLSELPPSSDTAAIRRLENDFRDLIGPDNIVVRTSGRASAEKHTYLRRTEGLSPSGAATWCIEIRDALNQEHHTVEHLAFIAHRFIAARASAWVRAEPGNPAVEIHSLWGLPDALHYCPYDIWEVHLPTEVATEYPDYKSHMLVAHQDGGWEYVRIKNELGRSLSIGRREAIDLATRTAVIADRLGQPCHVMWFVGCLDQSGVHFSIPWYWTKAHDAEKNLDRSNYQVFKIENRADLEAFEQRSGSKTRLALELMPTDQNLMRDMKFIGAVGTTAKKLGVPVILAGSTLGHAYFELRRQGCTVVTRGEKEHSRIRRNAIFGKMVRDKIPARIAQRKEVEVTRKIPTGLKKGYLTSKLLEEALEARNAETPEEKRIELADLYEVVRALARNEGIPLEDVVIAADEKRVKAGGFDEGLILFQTGIRGRNRDAMSSGDKKFSNVLARKISDSAYELPFTFFGFMELNQQRSLLFENMGIYLNVTLKSDRIELELAREAEQLELSLDPIGDQFDDAD